MEEKKWEYWMHFLGLTEKDGQIMERKVNATVVAIRVFVVILVMELAIPHGINQQDMEKVGVLQRNIVNHIHQSMLEKANK